MKGIDISNYNNVYSFEAIKNAGYEVVYLKATEGLTYNDTKMRQFYNGAKAVGLKVGFYHFMRNNSAIDEAKHFLSAIDGLDSDCLYALDVEADELQASPWGTSDKIVDFCEYLKSQGKKPCIYANPNFWNNIIVGNGKNYPLWLAQYSSSPSISSYVGWQYSEHGSVSGISGDVDMDEFSSDILLNKTSSNSINTSNISTSQPVQDSSIANLQRELNSMINANLVVDGIYGQATKSAIERFQSMMGLAQDGIAGNNTWGAINQIRSYPTDGVTYPHYEYATRWIQWRVGASIDGVFGNGTAQKVEAFQRNINASHGENLSVDGIVGTESWRCMFKY